MHSSGKRSAQWQCFYFTWWHIPLIVCWRLSSLVNTSNWSSTSVHLWSSLLCLRPTCHSGQSTPNWSSPQSVIMRSLFSLPLLQSHIFSNDGTPKHLLMQDFQGNFHHHFSCLSVHLLAKSDAKIFLRSFTQTLKAVLDTYFWRSQTNPVNHMTLNPCVVMTMWYLTPFSLGVLICHFQKWHFSYL